MQTIQALAAFLLPSLAAAQGAPPASAGRYAGWRHDGVLSILTSPEGADLPSGAVLAGFPLLVRLHQDWFDFSQAKADGADLRFSTPKGEALPYEIEQWDPDHGTASIWVRIPRIEGQTRQVVRMHWGAADAASESNGKAVFNESNGYLSVWHLGNTVQDAVGTLASQDTGTTAAAGMVGKARHFAGGQGVFGGDKIADYPKGSAPHTSEAWIRPEKPNSTVLAWGNEQAQGKVVMHFQSPPHVQMDCYFSDADVGSSGRLPMNEWIHVVHSYQQGASRVYVDGALAGASQNQGSPLAIQSPAKLWIGGWYDNYDFVGDIDEVRISNVTRSPEWIRLEFENQKAVQTLVGPLIQPGAKFLVAPAAASVMEGQSISFTAQAGGAQKVYWSLVRDGVATRVASDRFTFTFEAGRVTGDTTATLRFEAVYPDGVKTLEVPISIREEIAEPQFTLRAPAAWDGRATIEVVPEITNLAAAQAKGAGDLKIAWSVSPIAVIQEAAADRLILVRAQNRGEMTVTATVSNGGKPALQSVTIAVTEPAHDAWTARAPAKNEKPEDGEFYAREDQDTGTLFCNGTAIEAADAVFLKVFADEKPYQTETVTLGADKSYAFAVKLRSGLIKYRVELGARTGGRETVLHTAKDLVCGDAFLINGQSNAVATDWGEGDPPPFHSEWIRTFGSMSGSPEGQHLWGEATYRGRDSESLQIGYWAMELARRLVESQKVPICIINGAVGGTRVDQHQRNVAQPTDMTTIYGRLLWRVREARLTHGIRGVIWHQGENDQGADGPTGGFGWETYRHDFIELAAAWKRDYPNIQHYHVFQIWPKACAMGIDGSDNHLREVQRNLPTAFSRLNVMSTLGIEPPGGCHYPRAGYEQIAVQLLPLFERDHYAKPFTAPVTPPNLLRAHLVGDAKDAVALEFDQPVKWDAALVSEFYLDGVAGQVASGRVAGSTLTLKLTAPSSATTITYLDSKSWSQSRLLRGENGIAALTFCDVALQSAGSVR